MNIQNCSSCCQFGGIVRYSSDCLHLYHPDSQELKRGQWICKNSMWSWVMENCKLDAHRPSLDRAQVSSSGRSFLFVSLLLIWWVIQKEEKSLSLYFFHICKMGILSRNLLCKVLWDLLKKYQTKVSIIAFPSKWHNHDCVGDQIKKLDWQFPQVLHGKKEGQLTVLNLSMTSFQQKTNAPFSPLSPWPDLLEEVKSHHGRQVSKGLGPRVSVSNPH